MMLLNILVLVEVICFTSLAEDWDKECSLDSRTIYPYVVKLWHVKEKMTFGHGAIISYFAVLSACANFLEPRFDPKQHPDDYEIVGNKVLQVYPTMQVCRQTKGVQTYIPHPKCVEPTEHIFDFSIFLLKDPFNVDGAYSYPTMPIPNDPLSLMQDILFFDSPQTKITHCELTLFYFWDKKTPMTFNKDWQVKPIPFQTQCEALFCEYEPRDEHLTKICNERYGLRVGGTRLCMKPQNSRIDGDGIYRRTYINWYAGAPMVCNGTAYGLVTMVKWRHGFTGQHTDRNDFFYITTFIRSYGWIMENKIRYGANWIHPFFIELENIEKKTITTPSRPPKPEATLFPAKKRRILEFIWQSKFRESDKKRSIEFSERGPGQSSATLPGPSRPILGFFSFAASLLLKTELFICSSPFFFLPSFIK